MREKRAFFFFPTLSRERLTNGLSRMVDNLVRHVLLIPRIHYQRDQIRCSVQRLLPKPPSVFHRHVVAEADQEEGFFLLPDIKPGTTNQWTQPNGRWEYWWSSSVGIVHQREQSVAVAAVAPLHCFIREAVFAYGKCRFSG